MDCDPVCEDPEDVMRAHKIAADAACCSKNVDEQICGVQVVRLLEHVSAPSCSEDFNRRGVSATSSGSDKSEVSQEKRVLHLHEHIEAEKQSDVESGNDLVCFCRTPTSWSHADMEEASARGDEFGETDDCHETQSTQNHHIEDENVRRPFEREVKFQAFVVQFDGHKNRYMPVGEDGCFLAPSFLSAENAAAWFVHGPGRAMHIRFALQAVACMPVDLQQHMLLRMSRFSAHLDEKMSLSCRARACLCGISLSDQLEAEYWHSRVSTCADACGGSVRDYNKYSSCHDLAVLLTLPTTLASRCIHLVAFVPVIVNVRATCRMMDALILNSDTWIDVIVDATSLSWQSMHANSVLLKLLRVWRASGVLASSRSCVQFSTRLDQVYLWWKMYNSGGNSTPGHWFFSASALCNYAQFQVLAPSMLPFLLVGVGSHPSVYVSEDRTWVKEKNLFQQQPEAIFGCSRARRRSIIIPVDNLPQGQSWTRHGDLVCLDIEVFWTRASCEVLFDKKFRLCGSVPMTWPIRDWSYVYVLFQGENLSRQNVQVSESLLLVKTYLQCVRCAMLQCLPSLVL